MEVSKSHFQFKNPELEILEFEINELFKNDDFDSFDKFEASLDIARKEDWAKVSLCIVIGDKNENYPFHMRIVMSDEFRWFECSKEQVEGYLNVNAPSLLLSYMRPIIASVTNSSRHSPLNLPFINFTETFEKRQKVEEYQPAE